MSRWQTYPAYKSAKLDWLGQIPAHWETIQLKRTVKGCQNGVWGESPDGKDDVVCIRVADFDRVKHRVPDGEFTIRSVPEDKREGRLLQVGDLLLEKSGGGDKQPVGAVVKFDLHLDVPAVCSNFIARMPVASGCDSDFLNYLHTALYAMGVNIRSIKQSIGIQNLDSDHYLMQHVPVPPLSEQRAIATFLNRHTSEIDALIRKHERLIELLEDKRSAVMSHVVTKGLDPDVPMKESGIGWLRGIPRHWEVVRLKFVARVQSGVAKGRDLAGEDTIEVPYLRVANVQQGFVDLSDVATITIRSDEINRYSLETGDILMTEGGDFDKLGRGTVWKGQIDPCIHQNHIFAVRASGEVGPRWIAAITQADYARHYFILRSKQSTNLASISMTNLVELPVIVPPEQERSEILTYLDRETAKIDALVAKSQTMIDRLQEYRAALISAAVTGKIDVRDEVLPA